MVRAIGWILTRFQPQQGDGRTAYERRTGKRYVHDVMTVGTLEEHIRLVYTAIDYDGDGHFTFEEIMRQFLKFGLENKLSIPKSEGRALSGTSLLILLRNIIGIGSAVSERNCIK